MLIDIIIALHLPILKKYYIKCIIYVKFFICDIMIYKVIKIDINNKATSSKNKIIYIL
jgi:hypothetical protein